MRFFLLLLPLLFFAMGQPAGAARLALIVGNNSYDELTDLSNTHADADAYGKAFENLGYRVTNLRDLSIDAFEEALDDFTARILPGDEVVFIFSGHGWSDGSGNYLIPTDAPKRGTDRQLRRNTLALQDGRDGVLDRLEQAGAGLTIAIIDACRDNPFQPKAGTRSAGMRRGLVAVQPVSGTFVVYSAGNGQQALDRLPTDTADEKLSVFTRSLVPQLKPGRYLQDAVFEARRQTVDLARRYDGHQQHPAYYDQTLEKICLSGDCTRQSVPADRNAAQTPACEPLYSEARSSAQCHAYDAYLNVCGGHAFAPVAKAFIARNCAVPSPGAEQAVGAVDPDDDERVRTCDALAGDPRHPDLLPGVGVAPTSKIAAQDAIRACRIALGKFPDHPRMTYNLGRAYVANKQFDLRSPTFRKAADLGDPVALTELASCHFSGCRELAGSSYETGFDLYMEAAETYGYSYAMLAIAGFYKQGAGVEKDYDQALAWYRKSALAGNPTAAQKLGVIYEDAVGVARDYAEAVKWYQLGADRGDGLSMAWLSRLIDRNPGAERDPVKAAALAVGALEAGTDLVLQFDYSRQTSMEIQKLLQAQGVYAGKIDGAIGSGTKASMRKLLQ